MNKFLNSSRLISLKNEDLKEEINALSKQIKDLKDIRWSLEQKIIYYNNLRDITDKIQILSLEDICQALANYTFFLIGKNKGVSLLYLVDPDRKNLNLYLSKKEDKELVIKQKQGDIFDFWVIKHGSSLLVENSKIDFRFDLEKTDLAPQQRAVSSLIPM